MNIFFAIGRTWPQRKPDRVFCSTCSCSARDWRQDARHLYNPNGIFDSRSASPFAPDSVAAGARRRWGFSPEAASATNCSTLPRSAAAHTNSPEATTATHCNTLQHTATHCNTLQHTATHCNTATIGCGPYESFFCGAQSRRVARCFAFVGKRTKTAPRSLIRKKLPIWAPTRRCLLEDPRHQVGGVGGGPPFLACFPFDDKGLLS